MSFCALPGCIDSLGLKGSADTASFSVFCQMPIELHGAGLGAQVPLEDVRPSCRSHGVCSDRSNTCIPVACWRSFCNTLAVFLLLLGRATSTSSHRVTANLVTARNKGLPVQPDWFVGTDACIEK